MSRRRWVLVTAAGGIALAVGVVGWAASGRPAPSLPAGSIAGLDVSLRATPEGQAASKVSTADPAKIEALAAVLRRGSPVEDHKCGETGSLGFRMKDGTVARFGLLAGHDRPYHQFRAYSGGSYEIFRVGREALQGALSGLGVGPLDPARSE